MLNNVKSIKILKIIYGLLKKKIKLKLVKYNKKMINKFKYNERRF